MKAIPILRIIILARRISSSSKSQMAHLQELTCRVMLLILKMILKNRQNCLAQLQITKMFFKEGEIDEWAREQAGLDAARERATAKKKEMKRFRQILSLIFSQIETNPKMQDEDGARQKINLWINLNQLLKDKS